MENFVITKMRWFYRGKLLWWSIAFTMVTALVIFVFPSPIVEGVPSDFRLRFWSIFLQLVGAYIVWRDLIGSADDYGAPGVIKSTWHYLEEGMGIQGKLQGSSSFQASYSSGGAIGQVRPEINSAENIEHRLQILEKYVKQLDADVAWHAVALQKNKREHQQEIAAAKVELKQLISELDDKLRNSVIGSYPVLLFGACWVVIGTILSGFSSDIVKLVAHQYHIVWIGI